MVFDSPNGSVTKQIRTFDAMTADLLALSDWLAALEVPQIALESPGVYWQPVYALLETEARTLVLVNAQHINAVPGRKTDVKDSEWLADPTRGTGSSMRALCPRRPCGPCAI
jgi:hypothetical protein